MIHLDRVLFATDGSKCAEHARRHAFHLADHFDAAVHVIRVEEREVELYDTIEICESDLLAELHTPHTHETTLVAEPRVQERRVAYPSAAEGILQYAEEHDMNLIVLGTHGRRGVRRLVLGSVAEEVVRRAPRPVVTVGRGANPPEMLKGGHLLIPVDFSEYQARLLAHAREIALVYGMRVTLLHVVETTGVPDVYGLSSEAPEPDERTDRTKTMLEKEASNLREHDLEVGVKVRNGYPAAETLDVAEELDVDFLAIATHGRRGLDRVLMGSVAEKVIRQAPCPVFTVKSFGASLVPEDEDSTGS